MGSHISINITIKTVYSKNILSWLKTSIKPKLETLKSFIAGRKVENLIK
jgi:hypothetical protein